MFSQACVKNSVHDEGEGFSVPACTTGHMTRGFCPEGGLCRGGSLSGGSLSRGSLSRRVFVQWEGGSLSRGGGWCPRGLCLGVSVQGVSVRETPHTVTSGRYASYWNAFLFGIIFAEYCKEIKKIGLGVREGHPRSITANIIIAAFLLLD